MLCICTACFQPLKQKLTDSACTGQKPQLSPQLAEPASTGPEGRGGSPAEELSTENAFSRERVLEEEQARQSQAPRRQAGKRDSALQRSGLYPLRRSSYAKGSRTEAAVRAPLERRLRRAFAAEPHV